MIYVVITNPFVTLIGPFTTTAAAEEFIRADTDEDARASIIDTDAALEPQEFRALSADDAAALPEDDC